MRVRSKVRRGNAVCWSISNVEEVKAVIGESFAGLHSEYLLARGSDGEVCWVRPGWWVARWDGAAHISVYSAGEFADGMEAEPQEQMPGG